MVECIYDKGFGEILFLSLKRHFKNTDDPYFNFI